jgi:hypothetical protein
VRWRADSCFSSFAQPLLLLLQPGGVVALPGDALAAVQLQDPLCHVVQEVAVVRDGHDGALERGQVVLQPRHGLGVQVVGGLVEQEHVRLLQQHLAERDAPLLAAGEVLHPRVGGGRRSASIAISILRSRSQRLPASIWSWSFACSSSSAFISSSVEISPKLHVHLVEAAQQVALVLHRLLHVAAHVQRRVQLRLLRQVADARPLRRPRLAVEVGVQPRHDAQQRALAGAVGAHHADLGAGIEGEPDVLQDLPVGRDDLGRSFIT